MKQTITCEIEIPDEWEFDAIRPFKPGEVFLSAFGTPKAATWSSEVPHIVLRRAFVWPSWLKCAAIAKYSDGHWYAHSNAPVRMHNGWQTTATSTIRHIHSELFDISSFPDVPWEQSLRINPNWKSK